MKKASKTFKTVARTTIVIGFSVGQVSAQPFTVTVEDAANQSSTASFSSTTIWDFNTDATGANLSFSSSLGSTTVGVDSVTISIANEYGGALLSGSPSKYAIPNPLGTTISIGEKQNYFGLYVSALSSGNIITFYDDANEIA